MHQRIGRRDFVRIGGGAAVGAALVANSPRRSRAQVTTVSYGTPGGVDEDEAWIPVFEAFNESHPDIEAVYMPLGGGYAPQYLQNLQARIAGGNAPDVFFVMDGLVAGFAERNVIVPIDDYLQAGEVQLDDFFEAHLESFRYEDQIWGLPRDGAPMALFYNAALFDEAGIAYPDETWDWGIFLEAATALTKRDEGGRAVQLGTGRGEWVNWVWQAGGDILDAAGSTCLLGEPEAIEGLRFAQDLVLEHQVAPSAEDLADQTENDMFLAGRLAMFFGARGALGAICNAEFPFDAAIAPQGPARRMTRTNVGPTVLWSGSQNPEAAFELMRFICSAEGQRLKIEPTGFAFPSRVSSANEEWFTEFQCGQSAGKGINLAFREEIEQGWVRTWPTHPRWPEISTAITEEIDALYQGNKTPEQTGEDAARKVNEFLAEPA